VLSISLLAVLPQSLLQGYAEYSALGLIAREFSPLAFSSFLAEVSLVGILMNPVLLFVLMYVFGAAVDMKKDYPAVVASLFLGALIGGFAGRTVIYIASPSGAGVLSTIGSIAAESLGSAVSAVFVGFSGAALAFFRRPRPGSSETKPE
jgi:hypothetical protein